MHICHFIKCHKTFCVKVHLVFFLLFNQKLFEFVMTGKAFGGWENKRTTLRRKRQDMELTFTYTDEILSEICPLKMLIEITTG